MRKALDEVTLFNNTIPSTFAVPLSGNANDISGSNKNGTVTGAVLTNNRFEESNKAYIFDGVDDQIAFGNVGDFRSVSMWIKLETTTEEIFEGAVGSKYLIANNGTLSTNGWGTKYVDGVSTSSITAGVRHHVVVTAGLNQTCSAFTLGKMGAGFGNVTISDVYGFINVLSAQQVATIYAQQKVKYPSDPIGLLGYTQAYSIKDYAHIMAVLSMSGTISFTIKFVGSQQDTPPDFSAAQSNTNRRAYIQSVDYQNKATINGTTGISLAATNDVRQYELNINGLKWVGAKITQFANGQISLRLSAFENI